MRSDWIAVVAGVEWHAGYRAGERPVAITMGGARFPVEVERSWTEGSATAGQGELRVFLVRDGESRCFRVRASGETVLVELKLNR